MKYDVIILGGGWAGVTASYFLLKSNPNLKILCIDKASDPGGLLRTIIENGFIFDVGGSHVIFSKNVKLLREILSFLKGNAIMNYRRAYVKLNNLLVPYPFENGIWVLPRERRAEILMAYIEALINRIKEDGWKPSNLHEWIYGYFGREIARIYLEPYNKKIWKRQLEQIDVDWVSIPARLPIPDWKKIIKSSIGLRTEGYVEQARFYYPLKTGIQALYNAVLKKDISMGLKIIYGLKINKIRRVKDRWIIDNRIEAKKLISTIPLNELIKVLQCPEEILKLASMLDSNAVIVVGVALRKTAPKVHWVYVPEENVPFHRYAWISNYSPYNTPDNSKYSTIIAEISLPSSKVEELDKEEVINSVLEGMMRLGIISESEKEVLFTRIWVNAYGYPVHTFTSNEAKRRILNYVEENGIITLGRWGRWNYVNIDRIYEESKKTLAIYFNLKC